MIVTVIESDPKATFPSDPLATTSSTLNVSSAS